jgi:RNase P/RNase MRP subunit POP5
LVAQNDIYVEHFIVFPLRTDEIDDEEFLNFAIEHYSEMFGYINTGRVNIRIHRDIEGEMWFGVG